jgi:hypothetical protein
MQIAILGYKDAGINHIRIPFNIYLINSLKWRCFGLGLSYVNIVLVSCITFSYNTWKKKKKNKVKVKVMWNEINIVSKEKGLKKVKQVQNTYKRPKLFSKSFKIGYNKELNKRNARHPNTCFQNLVPNWCVTILWDCGTLPKMIDLMRLWHISLELNSGNKCLDA